MTLSMHHFFYTHYLFAFIVLRTWKDFPFGWKIFTASCLRVHQVLHKLHAPLSILKTSLLTLNLTSSVGILLFTSCEKDDGQGSS